jgi:hypothetical protein
MSSLLAAGVCLAGCGGSAAGQKVAAPVFSPDGGNFNHSQQVTITSTDGATIRYTTDGTAPSETSGTHRNITPC